MSLKYEPASEPLHISVKYLADLGVAVHAALDLAQEHDRQVDFEDLGVTDLSVTELSITDLSVTDLSITDLSVTDLSIMDLSVTDLSVSDLSVADLSVTDLSVTLRILALRSMRRSIFPRSTMVKWTFMFTGGCVPRTCDAACRIQGYLAHKKRSPP